MRVHIQEELSWHLYFIVKLIWWTLVVVDGLTQLFSIFNQFMHINLQTLNLECNSKLLLVLLIDLLDCLINLNVEINYFLVDNLDIALSFIQVFLMVFDSVIK